MTRAGAWLAAAAAALLGAASPAAELSDQQVIDALTIEVPRDVAIRKGLEYLRARQQPDGSVGEKIPTALTSIAVMAHLAAGVTPSDPQYGPWIRNAVEFVLSKQDKDGYFGSLDSSRMYGHGMATLMLAEALGMCRDETTSMGRDLDERIRGALERAVAVTVGAARIPKAPVHQGGWRYTPADGSSDLSLSGWQLMGLHAAEQVGIAVPPEIIAGAIAFVKRMTTADGNVGYDHPPAAGEPPHVPLRGLSMLAFAIGREQEAKEVSAVAARIQADPLVWQGAWLLYRAYYDAVGMSRAAPEAWDDYGPKLEKVLVEHQNPDGSWPVPPGDGGEGEYGPVYLTSMAILALAVQRHVLPAYQR